MARLKIRVHEKNGKTVSKFGTANLDKVIFQNNGSQALAVTIEGATASDSPLCDLDGDPVPTFNVPKNRSKVHSICGDWNEFKYTAQITGTQAEDPVVIIERSYSSVDLDAKPVVIFERSNPFDGNDAMPERQSLIEGGEFLAAVAGLGIGLLVSFVWSRAFGHRAPRT